MGHGHPCDGSTRTGEKGAGQTLEEIMAEITLNLLKDTKPHGEKEKLSTRDLHPESYFLKIKVK